MELKDRVAIVTGGGRGIGLAISQLFAKEGAKVVVAELDAEVGEAAARSITSSGGQVLFVRTDVTDTNHVRALMAETERAFGGIDILVNNAGVDVKKSLLETTDADWDYVVDVNLKSLFVCAREAVPSMLKRKGPAIVNVASVVAVRSEPNFGAYCASKAGVLGLTRSMVVEWSPLGIRVNALLPGPVDTPMKWRWVREEDVEKVRDFSASFVPLGRIADPAEVAEGALWLCSRRAGFVSGNFLTVDGGWMSGR